MGLICLLHRWMIATSIEYLDYWDDVVVPLECRRGQSANGHLGSYTRRNDWVAVICLTDSWSHAQ